MIRFQDKTITNGPNRWTVSGTISPNKVELDLTRFHGNVTDRAGLRQAIQNLLQSKPRYQRALTS